VVRETAGERLHGLNGAGERLHGLNGAGERLHGLNGAGERLNGAGEPPPLRRAWSQVGAAAAACSGPS
jgi:hypothetical protein